MDGKTVLITGVKGFIGRHLYRRLKGSWSESHIVGLDRTSAPEDADVEPIDLLEPRAVTDFVRRLQPDYIFHLAGLTFSDDWSRLYTHNVQATRVLLEASTSCGRLPRVVVPGSAAEYGWVSPADLPLLESHRADPMSPYGVSKLWQTAAAQYYACQGVDVVVGRIFNLIGTGVSPASSIGSFADQLRRMKAGKAPRQLHAGNLSAKRDFLDIADVCDALIALAQTGRRGEIYNVCSGASVSMEHILTRMIELSEIDVQIVRDQDRLKSADVPDIYGSRNKLCRGTGWAPRVSLECSLRQLLLA